MVIICSASYTLLDAENRIHTLLRELFGDDQLSEGEKRFQTCGDLRHLGIFLHCSRIPFPQDPHRSIVSPGRLAAGDWTLIDVSRNDFGSSRQIEVIAARYNRSAARI